MCLQLVSAWVSPLFQLSSSEPRGTSVAHGRSLVQYWKLGHQSLGVTVGLYLCITQRIVWRNEDWMVSSMCNRVYLIEIRFIQSPMIACIYFPLGYLSNTCSDACISACIPSFTQSRRKKTTRAIPPTTPNMHTHSPRLQTHTHTHTLFTAAAVSKTVRMLLNINKDHASQAWVEWLRVQLNKMPNTLSYQVNAGTFHLKPAYSTTLSIQHMQHMYTLRYQKYLFHRQSGYNPQFAIQNIGKVQNV